MAGHDRPFTTSNYHITTTPATEWRLVEARRGKPEADAGLQALCAQLGVGLGKDHHGRRIPDVDELVGLKSSREAQLIVAEVMALVLYTGPMVRRRVEIDGAPAHPPGSRSCQRTCDMRRRGDGSRGVQ